MHIKLHHCLTQTGTGIVYPVGPSVPGRMYLPKKKKGSNGEHQNKISIFTEI